MMNRYRRTSITDKIAEFFTVIALGGVALIFGAIAASTIGVPGGLGGNYSNGDRTGTLIKLSNKGIFVKSWEGELNLGGFRSQKNSDGNYVTVANTFQFSTTPEVAADLQTAISKGQPVKLTYHQYLIKPFGVDTDYIVTKVETVK